MPMPNPGSLNQGRARGWGRTAWFFTALCRKLDFNPLPDYPDAGTCLPPLRAANCRNAIASITSPGPSAPLQPSYEQQMWPGNIPAGFPSTGLLVAKVR